MSKVKEKIFSYLGFAKKAGKIKAGVNAVASLRGRIPLLMLCDSASPNTKKDARTLAGKYRSALVLSKTFTIEELIGKENCKVVAVCDERLANAIINVIKQDKNEQFVILEA